LLVRVIAHRYAEMPVPSCDKAGLLRMLIKHCGSVCARVPAIGRSTCQAGERPPG